jgi:hypothetical protein
VKRLYALLAVVGLILPYYFLARFLSAHGLNLPLFMEQLFANDIATFFAVDLIIATIVFWLFAIVEMRRRPIRYGWLAIPATLLVGLSFALPLFLYLRERALERPARTGHQL